MAQFKFIGDVGRVFPGDGTRPAIGAVEPGDVVEADDNPNPQFFEEVSGKPVKSKSATTED